MLASIFLLHLVLLQHFLVRPEISCIRMSSAGTRTGPY